MTLGNPTGLARFVGTPPAPQILQSLPFLEGLPVDEVVGLLQPDSLVVDFPAGDQLTRQDESAEFVIFILHGSVRIIRRDKSPTGNSGRAGSNITEPATVEVINRVVGAGHLIGRYELVFSLNYSGTATAETAVTALCIQRSTLERLLYRYPSTRQQVAYQPVINRLRTLPLFAHVNLVVLGYLAEEIERQTVEAGAVLYTQNQPADTLFLIDQGQVELYHPRRADDSLWLGSGCPFGFPDSVGPRQGARTGHYGHWAEARTETTLFKLSWQTLRQVGHCFPQVIDPEIQRLPAKTLSAVSVFTKLTPHQQIQLAGFCSFQHIPQHHLMMQQGDLGDSMWILLENGRAVLSALDDVKRALPRTPLRGIVYFGETALLAPDNVESTVTAEPGSLWLRLHWQDFQHFCQLAGPQVADKITVQPSGDVYAGGGDQRQDYNWLRKGEVLLILRRRHWLALLKRLRLAGLAMLISLGFTWLLSYFTVSLWISLGSSSGFVMLTLIWGILDYLNDYFIVTNQRVIQQEKVVFISEQRREALLEQIQRIDVDTAFWGNVLNYGTISVYTAGTTGLIDIDLVPQPADLRAVIFYQRGLRYQRYTAESKLEIQNALEERLGLTVTLPSRVRADAAPQAEEAESLNVWKRVLRYISLDSQLQWESTDHIVWHKHWWILLSHTMPLVLLLLIEIGFLAGGLAFIAPLQRFESWLDPTLLSLELLSGLAILLTLGWIIWVVADWWNDTYTVTRDRIIDIEKLPFFFGEQRREAQLSDIQDIRLDINSPLKMLLNFGNIIVQTAATEGAFTFDHVPNPRAVKEEITRRLMEWRQEDERHKAQERSRDLPDWFEMYNRLDTSQPPSQPSNKERA